MDNLVYIGIITGTHALNGELKVISEEIFEDKVFAVGNNIFINNESYGITNYRKHKNYNLIKLLGYDDINMVQDFINREVYINKEQLALDDNEYLLDDLMHCSIIDNSNHIGEVVGIEKGKNCIYLRVKYNKEYLIPYIDEYIISLDKNNKIIYTKKAEELII